MQDANGFIFDFQIISTVISKENTEHTDSNAFQKIHITSVLQRVPDAPIRLLGIDTIEKDSNIFDFRTTSRVKLCKTVK